MTKPSPEGEKPERLRKRKIIALLLVLAAVLLAIIYSLPPREPVYAGEPLSYWLKGYDLYEGSEPGRQKADEIMREAGTNAIPTLLGMLRERDTPWKLKLIALAQKQHVITIRHVEPYRRYAQAASAFATLGSDGKVAVPELIEIYEMNLSPSSLVYVEWVFASIGPAARQAIPSLLRSATSTNAGARANAILALGRIHAEPKAVVPALIANLRNPDSFTRSQAALALREYGPDAKEAVPVLIEVSKDQDRSLSQDADEALQKIDPETAARVIAENQQAVK
jgi:hypothetical protein